MTYTGSCLCGVVAFEITGEFDSFYLCHCRHCQKDTGSAHGANLFSSGAKLLWKSGESKVQTFQLPKTRHVKCFCSVCGSALPSVQMNGSLLVVPAGSLDQDLSIKPTAHIYTASAPTWSENLEQVVSFDKLPK